MPAALYWASPHPPEQVTGDKTPPLLRSLPPISSSSSPAIPVPSGRAHGLQSFNSLTTCLFSSWPPLFTNHSLAPEGGVCVCVCKSGGAWDLGPQGLSFSSRATAKVRKVIGKVGQVKTGKFTLSPPLHFSAGALEAPLWGLRRKGGGW